MLNEEEIFVYDLGSLMWNEGVLKDVDGTISSHSSACSGSLQERHLNGSALNPAESGNFIGVTMPLQIFQKSNPMVLLNLHGWMNFAP
jgi:hypothetical protein